MNQNKDTVLLQIWYFHSLRPRKNGHHFADDIFKRIFFNMKKNENMKATFCMVFLYQTCTRWNAYHVIQMPIVSIFIVSADVTVD